MDAHPVRAACSTWLGSNQISRSVMNFEQKDDEHVMDSFT